MIDLVHIGAPEHCRLLVRLCPGGRMQARPVGEKRNRPPLILSSAKFNMEASTKEHILLFPRPGFSLMSLLSGRNGNIRHAGLEYGEAPCE